MDPASLTTEARAILEALVSAPFAWQRPGELRASARLSDDQADEAFLELDLAGWLDPWDVVDGLEVTLTCLAASILGCRLEEYGEDEVPRWVTGPAWRPPLRSKAPLARYTALSLVPEPEPIAGPEEPPVMQSLAIRCALTLIDPMILEANRKAAAAKERREQKQLAAKIRRRLVAAAKRAEKAKERRKKIRAKLANRRRPA